MAREDLIGGRIVGKSWREDPEHKQQNGGAKEGSSHHYYFLTLYAAPEIYPLSLIETISRAT